MSKKLLFALVISVFFLFLTSFFPRQSFALNCADANINILQKAVCNPLGTVMNDVLGLPDKENLSKFIVEIFIGVLKTAYLILIGDPADAASGGGGGSGFTGRYQGLASTVGGLMLGTVANPPTVNHLAFAKNVLSNNILGQPAYAETGVTYLSPVQELWEKSRNVAYGLFVVAIALIALGLMLRAQISPRVTITLANSLPRLFFALFLITFSYSIIGLIIDLGSVLKGVIDSTLSGIPDFILGISDVATNLSIFGAFVDTFIGVIINTVSLVVLAAAPTGPLAIVIGIIVSLVLAGFLLITFIKLFLIVLVRWAGIFVSVILAPLVLFWSAIPGQGAVAIKLFESVLVSVLTFPVIYFLILLAAYIARHAPAIYAPEGLGLLTVNMSFGLYETDPGTGQLVGVAINGLVSLGILAAATKAPDAIEEALNLRPLFKGGGGPAEAIRRIPIVGGLMK